MKQSNRWRAEWLWLLALVLPIVLSFWWFPGRSRRADDTYSTAASGKRAFFTLVDELVAFTYRHSEAEFALPVGTDTYCILGPARYPVAQEWNRLDRWLRAGHTLVFAARQDDPAVDLIPFGLRVVPDFRPLRGGNGADDENEDRDDANGKTAASGETRNNLFRRADVTTVLASGKFDWQSTGHVEGGSHDLDVLVSVDQKPQVVRRRVGLGTLIVVSSDYIFTNRALATDDNGLLAFRILECAQPQIVGFDESLNASGGPKVFGLLFDPVVRPITLQLLICTILFVWLGSRRFGGPEVSTDAPHRSMSEHAVALGNLHFKAGTGARAVAWYLDYFRNELRLHYATASGAQEATLLARRANVEVDMVTKLLAEANAVIHETGVSDSRAAALIRALAGIKHLLDRAKSAEGTKGAIHGA